MCEEKPQVPSPGGGMGVNPTGGGSRTPIRAWCKGDRPRERLRDLGPGAVSVRELLAVLVGSGGRFGSAMDVADRLLQHVGGQGGRGEEVG